MSGIRRWADFVCRRFAEPTFKQTERNPWTEWITSKGVLRTCGFMAAGGFAALILTPTRDDASDASRFRFPSFERGSLPRGRWIMNSVMSTSQCSTRTSETIPLSGVLGPFCIVDAAAKASPSVVNILVSKNGRHKSNAFASSGSGFLIDSNGTIVTNAHVMTDVIASHSDSDIIMITLSDGRAFKAKLVAWDNPSDIALLKVETYSSLPCCRFGSSSSLRAGEIVVAIGSALGMSNTVTAGIISCVERGSVELGLTGVATGGFIQTDAAINRGSSGGPLVNLAGEVIGVSCMKALAADGVSFAIPIDVAKEVINELLHHGKVVRPFLGVKLLELNALNVSQLRLLEEDFPNISEGVLVPYVHPKSPAERAGLMPGDIIISFGTGTKATTAGLTKALRQRVESKEALALHVIRRRIGTSTGGEKLRSVTVEVVPEEAKPM